MRQLETKVKLLEGDKLLAQVGWLHPEDHSALPPPTAPGTTPSPSM